MARWTGSWLVGGDWEKERSNERRLKFCVPTFITEMAAHSQWSLLMHAHNGANLPCLSEQCLYVV